MLVCVFCACLHTRPRVQRAPGLPCALFVSEGGSFGKPRAYRAARMRSHIITLLEIHEPDISYVIASAAKQSMLPHVLRDGLLRCARNDSGWNRGLTMRKNTLVVPANAWTHHHRRSWLWLAVAPAVHKINIGGYGSRLPPPAPPRPAPPRVLTPRPHPAQFF